MRATSYLVFAVTGFVTGLSGQNATSDGIAAFQQGKYSVAKAKLKAAVDERGRAFLGLSQAATGECKEAIPTLSGAFRDPLLQRLTGLAGAKCEMAEGNQQNAFRSLANLQKRFPDDPDVLYLTAKSHMRAFNDTTLAMFQKTPSSYRVHELSGEIFEIQNQFGAAAGEYRKAIELNSEAPDLHFRLGRALLLQSHEGKALDEAAEQFRAELKLSPEDGASEFQLGQIQQVKGDTQQAQSHFERALVLSPNFVQALLASGKIYTRDKQYSRAIAVLTRAIELQPANESAHYALMTAYRDAGQIDHAKAEKNVLDHLSKPADGEFSDFLKKLGEKPTEQ